MIDSILTTDRREFEDDIREADRPVVVEFRADWCKRCRELEPVVDELSETYEDVVRTMTVDVDEESRLANEYHVADIPTFLGIHRSNTLERRSGDLGADDLEALYEYLADLPFVSS